MKKIIILESLFDNNPKIGKDLYEKLLLKERVRTGKYEIQYLEAKTVSDFAREMSQIAVDNQDRDIMLHLVMHGFSDKTGLATPLGQQIPWNVFANLTRNVNINTKNRLFLTMAVCHGAYFMQEIKCWDVAPFKRTIGSFEPVRFDNALQCYEKFYISIVDGMTEDDAVSTFYQESRSWIAQHKAELEGKGETDFHKYEYALIDCEQVFMKIAKGIADEDESGMRARFDALCPEFGLEGALKERVWEMFKVVARKKYKQRIEAYASVFFMSSLIPENQKYVDKVKLIDWN